MGKVKSDAELRKLAETFFGNALKAVCTDPERMKEALEQRKFRLVKGVPFLVDAELGLAEKEMTARGSKLLGSKFGSEREISTLAWDLVADQVSDGTSTDPKRTVAKLLDALEGHARREFTYIAPNHAVGFRERGHAIAIGPVEAVLTDDLLPELLKNKTNPNWTITRAEKLAVKSGPSGIEFQLPPVIWRVRVKAAREFVEEEGLWLINVAISFLRLSYSAGSHDFFPSVGDLEAPAIEEARTTDSGFTFTEERISGGSHTTPYLYLIDESIVTISKTPQFQARAKLLFAAPKGSLAERFSAGLGWLTRGRQSADRAERFLYFFTAIEALLSSSDKTAPVVQTISRYAATVLQPDVEKRITLAKLLMSLYATRSALVHSGKRDVLQSAVDQLQDIAEHLYKTVMELGDLSQRFDSFHESLGEASYGLAWPT